MKTPQQIKFEHLIIRIIQSNAYVMERKGLLEDFKEDSEICYDIFCHKIYDFFYENKKGILFLDEKGRIHLNPSKKLSHHIYFELLSDKDYLKDSEDVIDYIDLALSRLEEQVETVCGAVL